MASDHRGRRKQPGLLKQVAAAWRRRRYGEPGHSSGSMFVPARHASANVSVTAVDFSEWLMRSVQPQDHLVLYMDIAGAEFEVREPAPASGSLAQVSPHHGLLAPLLHANTLALVVPNFFCVWFCINRSS